MWDYHEKYAHLYENIDIPEPATLWDDYKGRTEAIPKEEFFKIGRGDLTYEDQTADLSPTQQKKKSYQTFIKSLLRCAASVDDNLGRILNYLDKSHLTKNTIVIYTSDQDAFLGEHGLWAKRFMYEESIRMPFIFAVVGNLCYSRDIVKIYLPVAAIVALPNDIGAGYLGLIVILAVVGNLFYFPARRVRPANTGHTQCDYQNHNIYQNFSFMFHFLTLSNFKKTFIRKSCPTWA